MNRNVLGVAQWKPTSLLICLLQFVSSEPCSGCCCPLPVSCYIHVQCFPSWLLLEPCHPHSACEVTTPLLPLQLGSGNPPEWKLGLGRLQTYPALCLTSHPTPVTTVTSNWMTEWTSPLSQPFSLLALSFSNILSFQGQYRATQIQLPLGPHYLYPTANLPLSNGQWGHHPTHLFPFLHSSTSRPGFRAELPSFECTFPNTLLPHLPSLLDLSPEHPCMQANAELTHPTIQRTTSSHNSPVSAAGINAELIQTPVLYLLQEGECTKLLHHMQPPCLVVIQNVMKCL